MDSQEVVTSAAELKTIIDGYRYKVSADHKLYDECKAMYWPWHPEQWDAAKAALVARANYWRGEMLRAKHNVARYMRGEDLKVQHRHVLDSIEGDMNWLDHELVAMQNALADALAPGQHPAWEKVNNTYLALCTKGVVNEAEHITRYTYGG